MELKPGYKLTEVGVIPEDWEVRPLLTAVHIAQGQVDPKNEPYKLMVLVAPDHIEGRTGRLLDQQTAEKQKAISGKYLFHKGDIVYSKIRPYLRKAILAKFDGLCSADMYPLTPARDVSGGFILAAMLGEHFSMYAESVSVRSGMPKINRAELADYRLAFPPTLAEQEAIAGALGDADALIESLERLLAKKRAVKQGAMQELLRPKEGWKSITFAQLFDFSGGLSASRDQLSAQGICYLHYGDIHKSTKTHINVRTEFADIPKLDVPLNRVSSVSLLEDGDVVFVDASEDDDGISKHVVVVNPGNVPFIAGLHTIVAKAKTNDLELGYRRFCFQAPEIKRQFKHYAAGTKVSGISKTNIAKLTMRIPSPAEQTVIAQILSDMEAELAALERKLTKARLVKQGMMNQLLTGQVRLVSNEQ